MSVRLIAESKDAKFSLKIGEKTSTKTIKNIDYDAFENGEGLDDFATKFGKIYASDATCSKATVVNNEIYDIG